MTHKRDKFWMVYGASRAAPTFQHTIKKAAEGEAKRLAALHPGERFYVLQAVAGFQADQPKVRPIKLVATDDIPF
ncbi:hypothetical protein OIV19_21640 [Brucella sp. HL-2]|nr:hypothetical protein [Brucella sp. HL-2]MCV9910201.1 hypothetical protein [Brucella sp. HL-2]